MTTYNTALTVPPAYTVISPEPPDQLRGLYWENIFTPHTNENFVGPFYFDSEPTDQEVITYAVDNFHIDGNKAEYQVLFRGYDQVQNKYYAQLLGFDRAGYVLVYPIYAIAHIDDLPSGFDGMTGATREAAILAYATSIGYVVPPGY